MKLRFPESGEDLADAFNNAIALGRMQRNNQREQTSFFARFELIASDVEGDAVLADWFINVFTNEYIHVLRKDGST